MRTPDMARFISTLTPIAGIVVVASSSLAQHPTSYSAAQVSDGGNITGAVTLAGSAPAPKELNITEDVEVCAKEPRFEEELLVGGGGGLKNVVVWLSDIEAGKSWDSQSEPPELDQNGCHFVPHVVIVPVGEPLAVLNSDGVLHNLHTRSSTNRPINKAQPKFLTRLEIKFRSPEILEINCDAHGWMSGWIAVAAHPYYTITDADGRYQLEDIPAGTYTVEFWHEKLGRQTQQVTVAADAEAQLDRQYELTQ